MKITYLKFNWNLPGLNELNHQHVCVLGNTALHDCAESGSLAILELLLEHGALMEKDSYGMTPLLAAAVSGHTKVVEYLISGHRCQRKEKIDALELLGATYVDRKRDMLGALKYWKAAMEERHTDPPLPKPEEASPIAAYENSVEARSSKELEELLADPDDMRMQALLVRERILGPAHPDTSYYIRYRGAVYADMGHFERCVLLWTYALDMQQQLLEPLCPMTQSSLLSFVELFSFMLTPSTGRSAHPVPYADMLAVLQKTVRELELGKKHALKSGSGEREGSPLGRLLLIALHLMQLMCRQQHSFTADQLFQFKRTCYRLVRLNPLGSREQTALHLACTKEASTVGRYPVCSFPSVDVVRLLVEVGASVHAVDMDLNTPLHVAAMNNPCQPDIMRVLLDAGAHIDARNLDHRTSMMLLKNTSMYDIVSPLDYMNLQCLAARVIMEHGIEIEGHLPQKLEHFVKMH